MNFPTTAHELWIWQTGLIALYAAVAVAVGQGARLLRGPERYELAGSIELVFNGATFSTSLVILAGIWDESVLKLLGDTTSQLALTGLIGLIHSCRALPPRRREHRWRNR